MNLILIHTQESCKLWCIIYVYTHTYESYFDTRLGITQIVIEELPLVLAEIRGVDKEVDILKSQHAIQCVAVCCSVLQCVAARYSIFYMLWLYFFAYVDSWEISSGCWRRNCNCLLQPDENSEELTLLSFCVVKRVARWLLKMFIRLRMQKSQVSSARNSQNQRTIQFSVCNDGKAEFWELSSGCECRNWERLRLPSISRHYRGLWGRWRERACTATHCNTLQHSRSLRGLWKERARVRVTLQTATHCNTATLQHCNTATHCNTVTLQRTATHCNPAMHCILMSNVYCNTVRATLQTYRTATYCNTASSCTMYTATHHIRVSVTLQTATHCNTLQLRVRDSTDFIALQHTTTLHLYE